MSVQGESLRRALEALRQAEQKFAEAQSRYGVNHPEYAKAQFQAQAAKESLREHAENVAKRAAAEYGEAARREAMLAEALATERTQFDRLNSRAVQYQSLRGAAEADRKLYEELQRKVKEATINAGFRNSAVRIADQARPGSRPVSPNVRLAALLALLLSLGGGWGLAVLLDSVDDKVHDADQIHRHFGGDPGVAGSLPKFRAGDAPRMLQARDVSATERGRITDPPATFENAIRALRIAILRNWEPDARSWPSGAETPRSLLVTSSGPREGKSTVALSLALASARQGHRTLLIDASLQNPALHRMVGIDSIPGLADVLTRDVPWRDAVASVPGTSRLSVLPAGDFCPGAEDRLAQGVIPVLLQAYESFDAVIIDSHDVNESADTLQLATFVHGVLLVARAGRTRMAHLQNAVDALQLVQADFSGIVLNGLEGNNKRRVSSRSTLAERPPARALVQRAAE